MSKSNNSSSSSSSSSSSFSSSLASQLFDPSIATVTPIPEPTQVPSIPPSLDAPLLSGQNLLGFMFDLRSNPCFRSSMLWTIGLSSLTALHSFVLYKHPIRMISRFLGTSLIVLPITWTYCRVQAYEREKEFQAIFDAYQAKKKAAAEANKPKETSNKQSEK